MEAEAPEPTTREDALRRKREEKAAALNAYVPNGLEQGMRIAEGRALPFLRRDGLYGKVGSISTGSSTAFGAGYRDHSIGLRGADVDAWGAFSFTEYWALHARIHQPIAHSTRFFFDGDVRQYSYPREEFSGIGPDTSSDDRVAYSHSGSLIGLGLSIVPVPHVSLAGGLAWQWPEIGPGDSPDWPSIETKFDPTTAPGLDAASRFIRPHVSVAFDNRWPLNPRKGGLYRLDVSHVDDRGGHNYSFSRYDLELRQYVGLYDGKRLFAMRALATTTTVDGDDQIPFYLQPSLGGNDSLRGFRALRFRGPHRLLLQGEYRFDVWSGLETAFFVDAGKVAVTRSDLDFHDLEKNWGFGFRFNTDNGVIMRIDTAFGSRDGTHLHIVFGGVF
jgi:outer membrane protein assembly factor BamA